MLKRGQFVKEPPVEIGKFYQPQQYVNYKTPEERFIYSLVMGYKTSIPSKINNLVSVILKL
jgi:hypothetical protein